MTRHVCRACSSQRGIDSTIHGDIVRTTLQDGDGKRVTFDWGVETERSNGAVNAEWVHYLLSVDSESVQAFVDGKAVSEYGFSVSSRSSWATSDANLAYPDPTHLTDTLGSFPIGAAYVVNQDFYIPLDLAAGEHVFSAFADYGWGWHGGWFAITDGASNIIVGGQNDGMPDGDAGTYVFLAPADGLLTLHIHTGRWTDDVSWKIDDGTVYFGPPATHSLQIGGTGYSGAVNTISLHRDSPDDKAAECLYQLGATFVEVCPTFFGDGHGSTQMFFSKDGLADGAQLVGDAHMDENFGNTIQLDGDGDGVMVEGDLTYYAKDGKFTISLWFTRSQCLKPSDWALLWSHSEKSGYAAWRDGSTIEVYLGCAGDDSTAPGSDNVVRTLLRDHDGNQVSFDWDLSQAPSNGYVNSEWVSMILSVGDTTVAAFVDGTPVSNYYFEIEDADEDSPWVQSAT